MNTHVAPETLARQTLLQIARDCLASSPDIRSAVPEFLRRIGGDPALMAALMEGHEEKLAGAAFCSVRGVGYRRLSPDEAADIGRAARRSLRRKSKSAVRAMTALAATSNGLSPEATRRLSAEISTHGLLAELASDRAVAHQAEEAVRAPARVAQAFLDFIGANKVAAE